MILYEERFSYRDFLCERLIKHFCTNVSYIDSMLTLRYVDFIQMLYIQWFYINIFFLFFFQEDLIRTFRGMISHGTRFICVKLRVNDSCNQRKKNKFLVDRFFLFLFFFIIILFFSTNTVCKRFHANVPCVHVIQARYISRNFHIIKSI